MPKGSRKNADALLILHLASGTTIEAAAELAGVSRTTAHRRLRSAAFRKRVARARGELLDRAMAHLAAGSVDAATTLRNLLSGDNDKKVQLGAAKAILAAVVGVRSVIELEERIVQLEKEAAGQAKRGKRR